MRLPANRLRVCIIFFLLQILGQVVAGESGIGLDCEEESNQLGREFFCASAISVLFVPSRPLCEERRNCDGGGTYVVQLVELGCSIAACKSVAFRL